MKLMRRASVTIAVIVASAMTSHAQRSRDAARLSINGWRDAVMRHVPGQSDDAVQSIEKLTLEDRRAMNLDMSAFLSDLVRTKSTFTNVFLERAAVLHGDAAMLRFTGEVQQQPPADIGSLTSASSATSPFLFDGRFVVENDGEVVGAMPADWNWVFARSLLDLRVPKNADDAFVGAWYHATTSFMFRTRSIAEATSHLQRAAILLPEDARILFDRACLSESQGLPRAQQLLSDEDLLAERGAAGRGLVRARPITTVLNVLPVERANGEAEAFFQHALARDPGLFEARVHLSRLLVVRSRFAEALAVLHDAPARTAPSDDILTFHEHLFSARAERGLGNLNAAAEHVRQALALFPDAQSALMASSQIAILRGDEAGASEPLRHLASLRDLDQRSDPWWVYDLFTGRDTKALLTAMWAQAPGARSTGGGAR